MKNYSILVTGGAGFIGSHLVKRLIEDGHSVDVIDNLSPQVHGSDPKITSYTLKSLPPKANLFEGDASKKEDYRHFFEKDYDAIVCLAAETGTGQSMYQAEKYCKVNVGSIALLNDLLVEQKISTKKIILASSRSVYGEAKLDADGNPVASKECDPVNPQSVYAATKLSQENLLMSCLHSIPTYVFRFQNVYGPGQSLSNPYTGILSIFSTAIRHEKPIFIFEDGLMSRDFVYIEDVIEVILMSIYSKKLTKEIYNLGSGKRTTVLEVVDTLQSLLGQNVEVKITGEKRSGDIRHNFADLKKLCDFGYTPRFDFKTGASKFIEWVATQKIDIGQGYNKSLQELKKRNMLK